MSVALDMLESWDDLWECEVADEMVEMAESIDDVRGMDRRSGRMVLLEKGVDAVRPGDVGGEFPRDLDRGMGAEMFRNW